jgi:precorrin-2 dehydrogenase/sirohydrochlorin ferrochelatase
MSDEFRLPLVLDGRSVSALVVGGGTVAERRVRGLLAGGARVRVVALTVRPSLAALAAEGQRLTIVEGPYDTRVIDDAMLVVAATDDSVLNRRIALDAREQRRLVTVADAPEEGNCITPAVHRAGSLLVAVSAGGVPAAAARVRDAIAARFDERYGAAMNELRALRQRLLATGDRSRWQHASDALIGEEFCDSVERGSLSDRMSAWR